MGIAAKGEKMLLGSKELAEVLKLGYLTANPNYINAASVDVTLGNTIKRELSLRDGSFATVDLAQKGASISWQEIKISDWAADEQGAFYDLYPGEFILAHTVEEFNLPDNISGLFVLRSSMARNGLEHMQAGWADAGFNNAQLTLELKNESRGHVLRLRPGMRIGQMIFWEHSHSGENSYRVKGSYNGQKDAHGSNGGRD